MGGEDEKDGEMRTSIYDSALHVLRIIHRWAPTSIITDGEACIAALAAAKSGIRQQAYQLRRVNEKGARCCGEGMGELLPPLVDSCYTTLEGLDSREDWITRAWHAYYGE